MLNSDVLHFWPSQLCDGNVKAGRISKYFSVSTDLTYWWNDYRIS